MTGDALSITVATTGAGQITLYLTGELDLATAPSLQSSAVAALAHKPTLLILDLAGVPYLDSSAMTAFVRIRAAAQEIGCTIRLVNLTPLAYRTLAIVGLVDALDAHLPADPR